MHVFFEKHSVTRRQGTNEMKPVWRWSNACIYKMRRSFTGGRNSLWRVIMVLCDPWYFFRDNIRGLLAYPMRRIFSWPVFAALFLNDRGVGYFFLHFFYKLYEARPRGVTVSFLFSDPPLLHLTTREFYFQNTLSLHTHMGPHIRIPGRAFPTY